MLVIGNPCAVCGRPVTERDDTVWIRPFADEPDDPLFPLSDSVIHADCLYRHPEFEAIRTRMAYHERMYVKPLLCDRCGGEVDLLGDCLTTKYLRSAPDEIRFALSEKVFHQQCLRTLPDRDRLLRALRESPAAGKSRNVQDLIWELEAGDGEGTSE